GTLLLSPPISLAVPDDAPVSIAGSGGVGVSLAVPGVTPTWSGATGSNVRSKPLGWGVAGAGAGALGRAAAPVPGTNTTSTLPSTAIDPRSKETVVPSGLGLPCWAPVQLPWGRSSHA